MFESGACLLHISETTEILMPRDPQNRADTLQWLIAGLNSVEMVSVPWWFIDLNKPETNPLQDWLHSRLDRLSAVLETRDWLAAGRFTVADLLMADILRVPAVLRQLDAYPVLQSYTARVLERPAFARRCRTSWTTSAPPCPRLTPPALPFLFAIACPKLLCTCTKPLGGTMPDTLKPLPIKRYASRRLYNTETSDYVTLEDIAGFIRQGREVQIVDLKSGDDLTRQTSSSRGQLNPRAEASCRSMG